MLLRSVVRAKAHITAFSPWKRRPSGLNRNATPEMVHPGYFRGHQRRRDPDDPTRLLKPSHVLLKLCPNCNRTQYIRLEEKHHFHTCCEGTPMRFVSSMNAIHERAHKLTAMSRQWDVENQRPWCNPHKPRPKGRSKFAK